MGNCELDPYEAVITDLESRIAAMRTTIENLRSLRGLTGGVSSTFSASANPIGSEPTFAHDAFFQMTASDAARKYLSAVKKTATANTIADALVAGGWKSASKNVAGNVRTILGRNSEFVRINKEFGLAEWYPGRKTTKITPSSGSGPHDAPSIELDEHTTENQDVPSEPISNAPPPPSVQ